MEDDARTSSGRAVGFLATAAAFAVVTVAVVVGLQAFTDVRLPFTDDDGCTATVDGASVDLTVEQAENASLIAAIGVRRGMPARAVSIALATAYQESDLRNLDHGDRDSLGLFQQRPSQGWGSTDEVQDPTYASNAFYDALEQVDGYQDLEITVAAQAVQRSGFPEAYADHEADARVLASAFTGYSPEAFACSVPGDAGSSSADLLPSGLTERADAVRLDVAAAFGDLPLGGFAPDGVSTGHMEGSAHYDGRAVDVFFRPVNPANKRSGWALAHYLVAQADRLDVRTVIFDDRIWVAGRDDSWRDYDPPSSSGDRVVLEHRDHVHVDVFA